MSLRPAQPGQVGQRRRDVDQLDQGIQGASLDSLVLPHPERLENEAVVLLDCLAIEG